MESKSSPLQNSDRTRAASETIREKDKEEEENERDVQKREKMKKEEEEEKTGMSQKGAVDAKEEEEKKEKEGEEKPNGGVDLSTEKGRSMTEEGEKIRGVCTPENREEREENKKDEQLKKEEKENLQREEGRKSEDSVKMNGEKEEKKMSDISSSSLASSLLKQVMEVKAGSTNVNLSQSSSSSSGVRTPAAVAGPSVVWEKEVEDAVIAACLRALNYSTRKDLERRTRSGTGTEDKGRLCCGSETSSCCRGGPGGGGEEEENYSCSSSSHSHSHHHDHAGGVCTPEGSRKTSSDKGGEREEAEGHPHRREKKEDQDRSPSEAPSPDLSKEKEEQGGGGGRKTDKEDHEGHRSRTSRSGGQESFASSPSLSAGVSNVPVYKFQKDKGDHIGALLDENTSIEGLRNLVGSVAERAAAVYENVKAKGEAEGMELLPQEDRQLRLDVLKEALVREVQSRVLKQLRQERILDSHEGGLVANPSAYREGPLSYLTNEAIRDLMKQGVAVQHGFLGEEMRKKILKEVELIEYDGRFNEVFHQTVHDVRKDYMCWMSTNDLDRETQQGLWQLFKAMQALPFELNKKANLCLQMSWVFQLAVYQGDGAYYRKHMDGGYEASVDNGRKISALYYPNATDWQEKDGGYLRVYPRRRREQQLAEGSAMGADEEEKKEDEEGKDENVKKRTVDIKPAGDTLVLLRSRDMPHEVLPTYRKRFAVTLWITGPPGPGDDT